MGRKRSIITDLTKLSSRADETILTDEETVNKTIKSIKDVLYANDELVALSAPQLGFNSRLFCIKFANGDIRTFINPMITHTEGMHLSRESNPSVPDKEYIIPRNNDIEATYQTPTGSTESNAFKGAVSEVFQQMVNLLDGVLISDFGLEIVEGWDESSQEEREQVIDMYIESLKKQNEEAQKIIQEDENLKKIDDAINFMTGVANGTVKIEKIEKPLNREQRRLRAKLEKKLKKSGVI